MEPLKFTDQQKATYRAAFAPAGATDEQWNLFVQECERRALVPGKDVVFQLRSAKEYDKDLKRDVYVKKVTFITTIGALRLIADRSGKYEGHGPFIFYYGTEGGELKESKIPLGKQPHAVSVEGFRRDWRVPLFSTARFDAYAQKYEKDGKKILTGMWLTRGEEQLAKCCEAGMLRVVAPEECAGLNINEELTDIIDKEVVEVPISVTPVSVPQPIVAPPVNQTTNQVTYEQPTCKHGKTKRQECEFCAGGFDNASPQILMAVPAQEPPITAAQLRARLAEELPPITAAQITYISPTPTEPPDVPLPEEPEDANQAEFQQRAPSPKVQEKETPPTLFANTTPPPKAMETKVLPPMKATPVVTATVVTAPSAPVTRKENDAFLQRAAKIVRDVLPKTGMKDANVAVKDYLLRAAGVTGLKQIDAATWDKILKVVEQAATPEDAAAIVRGVEKK